MTEEMEQDTGDKEAAGPKHTPEGSASLCLRVSCFFQCGEGLLNLEMGEKGQEQREARVWVYETQVPEKADSSAFSEVL